MFTKFGPVKKGLAIAAAAILFGYAATVATAGFVNKPQHQTELSVDDLFAIQNAEGARVDYFLKIAGIEGESRDVKHNGEIELMSYSWGMSESGSLAHGGGGGKLTVMDFTFEKSLDKSTPKLMKACATGTHINNATLVARKAGKSQLEFLTIKFTDLVVSSYHTNASGDVPTESISFSFDKMDIQYIPQNADGSPGTPVFESFDFASPNT